MNNIADALVYATVYVSIAPGDHDRQHDDCRALESIADMLSRCTEPERAALAEAAARAMAAERAVTPPNLELIDGFQEFLDTLDALFPNDGDV